MRLRAILLIVTILLPELAQSQGAVRPVPRTISPPRLVGGVTRLDARLDDLVDPSSKVELLAEGFDWSEGPVWSTALGGLLLTDPPQNTIYLWREKSGIETWLTPSGYTGTADGGSNSGANGLTIDQDGMLILCQHGDRRVARYDGDLAHPEPRFATLADRWQGKRFNSPNDLAIHSSGAVYFTDPIYGLPAGENDPSREIAQEGVYRIAPDGEVSQLVAELERPNGIAFSPDERTLYVAQSRSQSPRWMAYDVAVDGILKNGRVLMDATELAKSAPGSADGLKVDRQGNIFASGPGGIVIMTAAGEHLGTISTGDAMANCAFGEDGRTLYMTADGHLARIRLKAIGNGFPASE